MKYNALSEYSKLVENTESYSEEYKKMGMSEESIKELVKFDYESYKSDRRFYSHISDLSVDGDESSIDIPCYDTYFFDSDYSFEGIEDERLKKILKNANKKEMIVLNMIVQGYTFYEISKKLNMTLSGISKIIYRMKKRQGL